MVSPINHAPLIQAVRNIPSMGKDRQLPVQKEFSGDDKKWQDKTEMPFSAPKKSDLITVEMAHNFLHSELIQTLVDEGKLEVDQISEALHSPQSGLEESVQRLRGHIFAMVSLHESKKNLDLYSLNRVHAADLVDKWKNGAGGHTNVPEAQKQQIPIITLLMTALNKHLELDKVVRSSQNRGQQIV